MGLFGSSGTRGVVGAEMTPEFVERLAAVVASYWDSSRIAIGRDSRLTGQMLANAASSGVASAGVDIDRVGIVPTPTLQWYLAREGIPGCMISASHNPPEYNGVKLFDDAGVELGGARLTQIETAYEDEQREWVTWNHTGTDRYVPEVTEGYVDATASALDAEAIRSADLTVAVDPGHGAGVRTSQLLCRKLGCRVLAVNDTLDGTFPGRAPEPVPESLGDLCRLVEASDANLGVAHDGDADRAMFVDEEGNVVSGDTALAVLADAVLDPGDTVVAAVNASLRLADAVADRRARLERTPIGSASIVERIKTCRGEGKRVPLAGEGNGGIFFPEYSLARDGAYAMGRMLELVAERPLSERAAEHSGYHLVRREVGYESIAARDRMIAAVDEYGKKGAAEVDRSDGVRLEYSDGWALVRASGTEPLIRVVAESEERRVAEKHAERLLDVLERA